MKKFLSIVLTVVMLLSVIPFTVNAAYTSTVFIGGVQLSSGESANCVDGAVVKSDTGSRNDGIYFEGSTLTLNGVTVTKGLYEDALLWYEGTLNLVVTEDSTLQSPGIYGIRTGESQDANLYITGNHTLNVSSADAPEGSSTMGIWVYSESSPNGSLSVSGKTKLIVRSGASPDKTSIAINCNCYVHACEGATIEAYASSAGVSSMGIRSFYGNIVVDENARMIAVADTAGVSSFGALTIFNYYTENRARIDVYGEALFKGYTAGVRFRTSPSGNTYATEPNLPYSRTLLGKSYDGSDASSAQSYAVSYTEDDTTKYYAYVKVNHEKFTVTVDEAENMHATRYGEAVQSDLMWYMDEVTYTADEGYYFPVDYMAEYSVKNSGITAVRFDSENVIVSGQPSCDVTVTLPAAVPKPSDYTEYPLWIAGIQVDSTNCGDVFGDGTVKFDAETNTLTLNDFAVSGISNGENAVIDSYVDLLTINVKGNNAVVAGEQFFGIYSDGSIKITGDGNLTVNGGYYRQTSAIRSQLSFTVDESFTGKLITNGGLSTSSSGETDGIKAENICIEGGFVCAQGGQGYTESSGLAADIISISNATVIAIGGNAASYSYGMKATDINISNSVVHAKGGVLVYISSGYYDYKDNSMYSSNRRAFSSAPIVDSSVKLAGAVGWSGSSYSSSVDISAATSALYVPTAYTALAKDEIVPDADGKFTVSDSSYYVETSSSYLNVTGVTEFDIQDGKDLIFINMNEEDDYYEYGLRLSGDSIEINGGRMIAIAGANKYDDCYGLYLDGKAVVNGTDIIAVGGPTYYYSLGYYGSDSVKLNAASFTAVGSTTIDSYSYGIYGAVEANDGSVVLAVGGVSTDEYSTGMYSSLTINGESNVMGVGCSSVDYSYGKTSSMVSNSGKGIFVSGASYYSSYGIESAFDCNYGSEIIGIGGYSEDGGSYGISAYSRLNVTGVVKAVGLYDALHVSSGNSNNIPYWCEIRGYGNPWMFGEGKELPHEGTYGDLQGYSAVTITALEAPIIDYEIYVGGVQVTSKNCDDVLGDGGTVKYDTENDVLILENANITGYGTDNSYSGIYCHTGSPLNILVKGENTVKAAVKPDSYSSYTNGIYCYEDINITLEDFAVLNTSGADNASYNAQGIFCGHNLYVSGKGTLNANGGANCSGWSMGISIPYNELYVSGSVLVNANAGSSTNTCVGLYIGNGNVHVSDYASITANSPNTCTNRQSYGFYSQYSAGINFSPESGWRGSFVITGAGYAVLPDCNTIYEYSTINYPADVCKMTAFPIIDSLKDGTVFTSGAVGTDIVSNMKKIAIFNACRLTFLSGYDDGMYMNMYVEDQVYFELPDNIFESPDGKDFDCWDAGEEGETILLAGDMTFNGEWWKCFPDVHKNDWFYGAAKYNAKHGFITGYSNGKFGPGDQLKRQDFVVILARIAGADLSAYENVQSTMPDVVKGSYYAAAVNWAVANGIIGGYTSGANKGKFGVGDPITREQVCVILYRFMGKPSVYGADSTLAPFADANKISSFAKDAMVWAIQRGVISGKKPDTLAPTATASRAEIATIVMRMDKAGMFGS